MRLTLINPSNPMASIVDPGSSRWNRFRVWKPLGLMVIAGLTPPGWEISIIDENLGVPDYAALPRPDLVGITAFTSQANRAYDLAGRFRRDGVPVVLGGIHATMRREEAARHADAVVTGEAEGVWAELIGDVVRGHLRPLYEGGFADMDRAPPARHDLLRGRYAFGAIQTTRGCPLRCGFCSVTSFNGARFRHRPVERVIEELRIVPEKLVLIVDDNLVGTRPAHIRRAKDLFRAMIDADLKKEWVAQTTINVADDEELLSLAARAGCRGLFIGFESPEPHGLKELGAKNNLCRCHDLGTAVAAIQAHGILVAGSFIIGLDGDGPGIGRLIADTAERYGVDFVNVLFLTPLPGTRLWDELEAQRRIVLDDYPGDWSWYTLTYPVARFRGLSMHEAAREMDDCSQRFYALPLMLRRAWRNLRRGQSVLIGAVGGLSYRRNNRLDRAKLAAFEARFGGGVATLVEATA
jgi:radical SAM superfamily enzyme YgiQ (UPF0313 family)